MNKAQTSIDDKSTDRVRCNRCNVELPLHAHFCSACGANLITSDEVPTAAEAFTTPGQLERNDVSADIEQTLRLPYISIARRKAAIIAIEKEISSSPVSPTTSIVAPSKSNQLLKGRPTFLSKAQGALAHPPVAVLAVVVGLITLLIHGYRLSTAPDIFSDEGAYLLIGTNLARGMGLVLDHDIFLWHPPVYFLVEAVYIKFAGLTSTDSLTALASVRYLNILFSAITASFLLLLGHKLHSYKAGWIMVALFLMDPYVQRINRRNMLETLAMLCVLLGLYIFFTHLSRLTMWQRFGSGVALGLAMLTKEPMFFELFPLIAYVMCFRRSQRRDVAWVAAIACAIYLLYPAWAIAAGQGNSYFAYKLFGITRVLSAIAGHGSPPPPPGVILLSVDKMSTINNIWLRLTQYGMSYLLIVLTALFTAVLILRCRHLIAANYLILWCIFSFGFSLALGGVSDQYFYDLIVPSIVVTGFVLGSLLEDVLSPKNVSVFNQRRPISSQASAKYRIVWKSILAIFLVMFLYNSYMWTKNYAVGSDNAYSKIIAYVKNNIPSGKTIVTSDDVAVYYLTPSYDIRLDRDTKTIIDNCERYFIMSSKDASGGYDETTPQFYNWVILHSHPLFEQNDLSFGKIGIYQLLATKGREGQCA